VTEPNAQNVPDEKAWSQLCREEGGVTYGPRFLFTTDENGVMRFESEDHYKKRLDAERGVYFMRGACCIKRITMKRFREITGGKYDEGKAD
jgi:hypothetical protein